MPGVLGSESAECGSSSYHGLRTGCAAECDTCEVSKSALPEPVDKSSSEPSLDTARMSREADTRSAVATLSEAGSRSAVPSPAEHIGRRCTEPKHVDR